MFVRIFIMLLAVFSMLSTAIGQAIEASPFNIGEQLTVMSQSLEEERLLNVYLPADYHPDSSKTYPVIFLLDGAVDEDIIHVAGLVQFASFPWVNIMPESIVVGIANVDRKRDFTSPSKNAQYQKEFPTCGGSAAFIDFLGNELIDIIEDRYRTNGHRTLIGQSLGGLLCTEVMLRHSTVFDSYIIISPSLWWNDEEFLDSEIPTILKDKSIYVGVGDEGPTMTRLAQSMFLKLSTDLGTGSRVFFQHFPKQNHGDVLHLALYDAFTRLNQKPTQK